MTPSSFHSDPSSENSYRSFHGVSGVVNLGSSLNSVGIGTPAGNAIQEAIDAQTKTPGDLTEMVKALHRALDIIIEEKTNFRERALSEEQNAKKARSLAFLSTVATILVASLGAVPSWLPVLGLDPSKDFQDNLLRGLNRIHSSIERIPPVVDRSDDTTKN